MSIFYTKTCILLGNAWNSELHKEVGCGLIITGHAGFIDCVVDVCTWNGIAKADKLLAEKGIFAAFCEFCENCAFKISKMLVNAFEGAVIVQEFCGGFYTNTANTRNIVGRVAVEGKKVEQLRRLNPPFSFYAFDSSYLPGFAACYRL